MVTAPNARNTPLNDLRVLEIDDGLAQFAGKLLADMGAEVIKLEDPFGGPATGDRRRPREVGPFAGDIPDVNGSLYFWANNTSKRSAVIELNEPAGRAALDKLTAEADVLLYGGPRHFLDTIVPLSGLRASHPRLVMCVVTPFGLNGPWCDYESSDVVQLALGGPMGVCGYDEPAGFAAGDMPIAPTGGHSAFLASMAAVIGILAAVRMQRAEGQGQVVDVAAHDVIAVSTEMHIPYWEYGHGNVVRQSGRHARPFSSSARWNHRCADGKYISALPLYLDDRRFAALAKWLADDGQVELLAEELRTEAGRVGQMARIVEAIRKFCATKSARQIFDEAERRRLPWAPVNSPEELLSERSLVDERQAFSAVVDGDTGQSLLYPAHPFQWSNAGWRVSSAPRLGRDTQHVLEFGFGTPRSSDPATHETTDDAEGQRP